MKKNIWYLMVFLIATSCSQKPESQPLEDFKPEGQILSFEAKAGTTTGNGSIGIVPPNSSKLATISIKNTGDEPLIGPPTLSSSDFTLVYQNNCTNVTPGKTCQIKFSFTSTGKNPGLYESFIMMDTVSIPISAQIEVPPSTKKIEYLLSAAVIESMDFGQMTDTQSVLKTLTIKNNGSAAINSTVEISNANYILSYDSCSNKNLAPKAQCSVKLNFNATGKSGVVAANLIYAEALLPLSAQVETITPGANSNLQGLSGNTAITNVDFGVMESNQTKQSVITIKNSGTGSSPALTVASSSADFPIIYNQCTNKILAPNGSCQIRVAFNSASRTGLYEGVVSINSLSINFKAQVTGAVVHPALVVTPNNLSPMSSGEVSNLIVSGGVPPYSYEIVNTAIGSTIGRGMYVAGINETSANVSETIRISDSVGQNLSVATSIKGRKITKKVSATFGTTQGSVAFYNDLAVATPNGKIFMAADDGVRGVELWVSNGQAEDAVLVKEFTPGSGGTEIRSILPFGNNALIFIPPTNSSAGQMWLSDGTTQGTVLISSSIGNIGETNIGIGMNKEYNGKLYFILQETDGPRLWVTNGNESGTLRLTDSWTNILNMEVANGYMFYVANAPGMGNEMWRTDGTIAGTVVIKDINGNFRDSVPGEYNISVAYNNELYFVATDGIVGEELWKTDGTEAGTVLVKDINTDPSAPFFNGSYIRNMHVFKNKIYFFVRKNFDGSLVNSLWSSDGTSAGTVQAIALDNNTSNQDLNGIFSTNNTLYFSYSGVSYASDGTQAGTYQIVGDETGSDPYGISLAFGIGYMGQRLVVGGLLYYYDQNTGLYVHNPGDNFITKINNFPIKNAFVMKKYNNQAFMFTGDSDLTGREPYLYFPSTGQTRLLGDINQTSLNVNLAQGAWVNGKLIYVNTSSQYGSELWVGNNPGSGVILKDLSPGSASSVISEINVVGNKMYFSAMKSSGINKVYFTSGIPGDVEEIEVSSNPQDTQYLIKVFGDILVMGHVPQGADSNSQMDLALYNLNTQSLVKTNVGNLSINDVMSVGRIGNHIIIPQGAGLKQLHKMDITTGVIDSSPLPVGGGLNYCAGDFSNSPCLYISSTSYSSNHPNGIYTSALKITNISQGQYNDVLLKVTDQSVSVVGDFSSVFSPSLGWQENANYALFTNSSYSQTSSSYLINKTTSEVTAIPHGGVWMRVMLAAGVDRAYFMGTSDGGASFNLYMISYDLNNPVQMINTGGITAYSMLDALATPALLQSINQLFSTVGNTLYFGGRDQGMNYGIYKLNPASKSISLVQPTSGSISLLKKNDNNVLTYFKDSNNSKNFYIFEDR